MRFPGVIPAVTTPFDARGEVDLDALKGNARSLLDDAVSARVQWLRLSRIATISSQLRRPRRRVAILKVESDDGRRYAFAELRPPTADAIVRHVTRAAMA